MENINFTLAVAIIATLLIYFYRSAISHLFSRNLERFKKLNTEQQEYIKKLYEKLHTLSNKLHSALKPFQHISEPDLNTKIKDITATHQELLDIYHSKKIFLKQDICDDIEKITFLTRDVVVDITTLPVEPNAEEYEGDRSLLMERHKFWDQARDINDNQIDPLIKKLENKFRILLGVNT